MRHATFYHNYVQILVSLSKWKFRISQRNIDPCHLLSIPSRGPAIYQTPETESILFTDLCPILPAQKLSSGIYNLSSAIPTVFVTVAKIYSNTFGVQGIIFFDKSHIQDQLTVAAAHWDMEDCVLVPVLSTNIGRFL